MSCGQAMFHLSSSWESYFSYSCVFQLLHECSSVGLKHFELRFVKDPCHTPLIPQTHSSHSNGVVKWRWKRNQALSAARPAKQVNHRKTQKNAILFFLSSFMFFLYVCFLRIWKDIKRERDIYIYQIYIYMCVCVFNASFGWSLTQMEILNAFSVICWTCVFQTPTDIIGLCCKPSRSIRTRSRKSSRSNPVSCTPCRSVRSYPVYQLSPVAFQNQKSLRPTSARQ